MSKTADTNFSRAVRFAATGLIPKRKPRTGEFDTGNDLAAFLRSDMKLGVGERELLALLVTGELQLQQGRKKISPETAEAVAIVTALNVLLAKGKKKKVAIYEIAKKFDISESTVRNKERALRMQKTRHVSST